VNFVFRYLILPEVFYTVEFRSLMSFSSYSISASVKSPLVLSLETSSRESGGSPGFDDLSQVASGVTHLMLDLELLYEGLSPRIAALFVYSYGCQAGICGDIRSRLAGNLALRDCAPLGVRDASCPFRWHYFSAPNFLPVSVRS
jgi:hypothetical protein